MKTLLLTSHILLAVTLAAATSLHAQSNAAPPALGLLRLNSTPKPTDVVPLAAGKFSVDELAVGGVTGASKARKNDIDYVALDAGKEWTRPLRGNDKDVTFVSFQIHASQTTIVDLAGARLGVATGPVAGSLQLMFDDSVTGAMQWKPLNWHVATAKYGGKDLVALPTLTIRIDPGAGIWDLFSGSRLLADNLPLIDAKKNDRRIRIRAGTEGAWITGLVLADENPLYEDTNRNGIDDIFEKQQRGGALLAEKATTVDRKLLAQQWRDSQRRTPPPALHVTRPLPDSR